jgi:hypothetical protein
MTLEELKALYPDLPDTQLANLLPLYAMVQNAAQTTGSASSSSGTTISQSVTKLTYNSAKAMLEDAAKTAGYPKDFSDNEINDYIKKFNTKQNKQIAKVVTIASKKITPDATDASRQKVIEQTMQEEYPSFFKPVDFAKDFVWGKVNFKDQTTLGNAAVGTLASIRNLVDSFHIIGFDESAIQTLALSVAKGDKSAAEAMVEVQKQAIKEYPQFAERFAKDPTLTTTDIASPVIDTLASVWDVDKKEIKWDNPLVMKWINGAGADGKGVQPTKYEIMIAAKKDPKYQFTEAANNDARDAATALGNAIGVGI